MRLLWIGLLVGGCVDGQVNMEEPSGAPPTAAPFYNPTNVYEEDPQCRDLLGPDADKLTKRDSGQPYASFALSQSTGLWSVGIDGVVVPPGGGSLHLKTLDGTANGVKVRFVGGALPDLPPPSPTFGVSYRLQYQTSSGSWAEYCPNGERATALKGRWKSTAFRVPAEEITFGCRGSAMRKCYEFGYAPDDGLPGTFDYDETSVRWRAHQACTRMARADYCGNGEPGTRPGTPIVVRDNIRNAFNPPPWGSTMDPLNGATAFQVAPVETLAPPDLHFYEAMWTWRENQGALYMSRERWKSVPTTTCPSLPDPRVDPDAKLVTEVPIPAYESSGSIVLLNMSMTQDMYLNRWSNDAGEFVATVRGFWRAKKGGGFFADPAPFPNESYETQVATDGILIRNPPDGSDMSKLTPVFSTLLGADRVLGHVKLPTTDPSFEGYLLTEPGANRLHYGTYKRQLQGVPDTVTGTDLGAPDWSFVSWLGYAFSIPSETVPSQ